MNQTRHVLARAIALAMLSSATQAQEAADTATALQPLVIIGGSSAAQSLPGTGYVVGPEQMDIEVTSDIHQVLKTVPGVYIREEDGFGLRPNIGIRAATGERSARITLMEDGILQAPAPYADPAAYYFPTSLRMHSVEVLKGAPLLRYGPYTTGGVLNLVSTPIPDTTSGRATLSLGSFDSSNLHAYYGGSHGQWGWLLEAVERNSNGYKEIDRSNGDSGFNISDYVGKLRWESASGPRQSLLFKVQRSEEVSNETYLGLTDADFAANADRRYGLSSIDQMTNDHTGLSLSYTLELNAAVTANAVLYRNDFTRDWFKLGGGSALINAANDGDAIAQGILDGSVDTTGLGYKHNAREYYSQGLELNFDIAAGSHWFSVGARVHEDEVDRFQPVEVYDQINGSLVFVGINQPSSSGSDNRVGSAEALSLWIQDDWTVSERLNVNLSLRYEDVESEELRYADLARTSIARSTSADSSEWLPGASFTYALDGGVQLLGGVHRGFSPLGAGGAENEDPETSINWEGGARYRAGNLFAEAVYFHSDFSEKEERCSIGTPCSNGETSGSFKTGEAVISGLEFQLSSGVDLGAFYVPMDLVYTWTQAEISADNAASGVRDGDQLKDIPEHAASLRLGLEHASGWNNYAVIKYLGETCVSVGCNNGGSALDETDALTVVDLISRYRFNHNIEGFVKVENVFDQRRIVSRVPDGARPNQPLTAWAGVELRF